MSKIAIITDSTADLTKELCEKFRITVVPLTLTIDGESMPDGTISQAEFFRRMDAAAELPTTSQPSVGAFVEAYRVALEAASHVISVHISSKLSGTVSSATCAAEEFAGRVHVVDSLNLSGGLGLQVLEAAKAAAAGLDVESVLERVHSARDRVKMLVGLESLDNLVRGGRLSKFAGRVGGMLNVKMTITPDPEGRLVPLRPVRGVKSGLEYTMKWIEQQMAGARRGAFLVMHAMSEEGAQWIREQILEHYEPTELQLMETGTVIATHTGVGWGVALLPEE